MSSGMLIEKVARYKGKKFISFFVFVEKVGEFVRKNDFGFFMIKFRHGVY